MEIELEFCQPLTSTMLCAFFADQYILKQKSETG